MISDALRIVVISDIHLGHPNTTTVEILNNLNRAFPNDYRFADIDLIFIAGDVFDRLMHLPDPNVIEIRIWISRFLRICQKHNVVLRVLEGTPSHDWKQSRLWTHLNDLAKIGTDVAYVETLSVEWLSKFGIHVLYIPDEWTPEPDETWLDVQKVLAAERLEQVDFVVMHGHFGHQLPAQANIPSHDSDRYHSITRYLIFIGHIHIHSIQGRILAPGSFDRLTHGEESPKGYLDVTVRKTGNHDLRFVENTGAKKYVTLTCRGTDVAKTLSRLEKRLNVLPPKSFVRIEAVKGDPILASLEVLKRGFPLLRFSLKVAGTGEITSQALIDLKSRYSPVALTAQNIQKLLLDRLQSQGVSEEVLKHAAEVLSAYC